MRRLNKSPIVILYIYLDHTQKMYIHHGSFIRKMKNVGYLQVLWYNQNNYIIIIQGKLEFLF